MDWEGFGVEAIPILSISYDAMRRIISGISADQFETQKSRFSLPNTLKTNLAK